MSYLTISIDCTITEIYLHESGVRRELLARCS